MERSLEMFLQELLKECETVAEAHMSGKLTPSILKKALLGMEKYEFMADTVDDIEDTIVPVSSKAKV